MSRVAWLMVNKDGEAVAVGTEAVIRSGVEQHKKLLGHEYEAVRVEYGGPTTLDAVNRPAWSVVDKYGNAVVNALRSASLNFAPLLASFRDDKTEVRVTEEQVNAAFKAMAEVDAALNWPGSTCHVCKGEGVYDTGAPGQSLAPCFHCGGNARGPR